MEQTILQARAPRTTLMKLLDGLVEKQVVYVHAPAGFGKTMSTLLWIDHRDMPQSWISLDEYDNKTIDFCRRFVSALAGFQPHRAAPQKLAEHPDFTTAPVEFTLHALNALTDEQDPCVFVLDDLHIIKNEEILTLLPVLLKKLPGNCMVLLLSRAAPPDSFSEMMAKGALAVVDAKYLQFTSGEIKLFFKENGRFITGRQADEIFASTGGWAIGIRALLLSGEKSYNIDLTGKYLGSFLKAHVWERWDDRTKRFMSLVSVVKELTPELCEWLIASEKQLKNMSGAKMLQELVRENAFLRETGRNTYQFHDLFRDFLLHMLEAEGGGAAVQWNRAGAYYFFNKDYFRAVEYYAKAHNDDGVAESLYGMYDYNSPYASIEDTLFAIRMSVSDALVEKHPFLLEVQTWAAYVEGRAEDFERLLDVYDKLFPRIVLKNPRSAIIRVLLRCVDYRDDFFQTMRTLRKIPFKGNVRVFTPSITNNMPFLLRSSRDFSELALDTEENMALFEKSFGVLLGAESAATKECLYAGIHYEKGHLNEACEHALAACAKMPDNCSGEIRFCVMMALSAALLANGQEAEAGGILADVEEMIERDKAFYLKPNLRAYQFRIKLAGGDEDAAKAWLKEYRRNMVDNLPFFKSYQHFTTARAYIVAGEYNHAVLFLKKLLQLCERFRRTLDTIEARILMAIAYWKKGRSGHFVALDYLEQAVAAAQPYGYTQVFANEGAELVNMLHRLHKRAVQKEYAKGLSGAFVKTLYIAAVAESKRSKGLTGGKSAANLTLTDKQKAVMRLMCEGCSRNMIAEKMGIKPNSVKAHTELIYRKLDVSNNVEAVLKVKELGMLDDKAEIRA